MTGKLLVKELMHSKPKVDQFTLHGIRQRYRRCALFVLFTFTANNIGIAATTNADFSLDDGAGDSPAIRFIDAGDQELIIQKLDSGEATFVNEEGRLCFEPSGDTNDFLCFETISDLPALLWEGISANDPGIRINGSGQLEYRDENSTTWVPFDDLASGASLPDGSVVEDKLAPTLAFDDGDLLDLSAINASSSTEGFILPQASDVSAATAEGLITWDTDDDALYIGDGSTANLIGGGDITAVGDITTGDAFTESSGNDGNSLFFEGSTSDSNEVELTASDPGADVVVTLPAATTTLVGTDTTDTLSNKTLTSVVLNTGVSGSAVLDEDTMATDSATQLATQQSIKAYVDSSVSGLGGGDITDVGDATGPTAFTGANDGNQLVFEGTTDDANDLTLVAQDATGSETLTLPATTDTLVGRATTDTLTNKTLTSAVLNTGVSGTAVLDEDNMATDSATQLATQQSIKAYVDSSVSGLGSGDVTDVGDSSGPTAFTGANDGNQLIFEGSTDDTNEVTLTVADPGADVTVTIPAATDTLVGRATTDTLTNKTLTSAVLNTGVSGTAILDEDTMATDSATQLATQQSIKAYVDSSVSGLGSGDITDVGDSSGPTAFTGANDGNQLIFEGSTDDTNEVTLTVADPGADVTVTIPAATDTLVGRATTDTLTNKTLTSPTITTGVFNTSVTGTAILDEDNMATDSATQLATQQSIKAYVDSSVSGLGSGDVTDVGDSSGPTAFTGANDGNQLIFEGSTDDTNEVTLTVADPGADVTVTIPAATDTLVGRATTDTLTNKTLTSPTITSGVFNTSVSGTAILDEDTMATDSATQLATQQSIKAYVDSSVSGLAAGDITDVGDSSGPTAFTGANDGNQLVFEGTTDDANDLTLVAADAGSNVTVTIPAATDTLVGRATTDTLTNKTLTSAVLNTGVSGTAILDEDNMATDSATQLATQQSIKAYVDSSVSGLAAGDITDVGDATGPTAFTGANDGNQLIFEGTTDDANDLTLVAADAGSNVTVTIPAATDTLVGRATTDTLTNKTLTSAVLNTGVSGTAVLDEDNMATDSATQLATQQSIKAYVDSSVSGLGSGDITDVGDSTGPTAFTGANDGNQLIFEGSTDDTNEVTLTVADPGADVTVTIPAATDTLVGRATTDTLTNKTLTSAVLNTGVSGTAILDEDNMATDSATQLATQQSIKAYVDSSVSGLAAGDITDVGDATGPTAFTGANDGNQLIFEGSTDDTNEVTLTVADPGADVTVTIPAATDTLVGRATTDTLTNKTLTSAVLNTGVSGTAILDEDNMATDSATQLATQQSIKAYVDSSVSGLGSGDITDVGDSTGPTAFTGANDGNQLIFEGSTDDTNEVTLTVADPGADVTITIPAATDTLVGRATTDTLTNKTLTSAVLNTGVSGTAVLDEDNMATDSATQLATQQSIKAYVDSSVSGLAAGDITDVGDATGPTAFTGANDGNQLIFEGSTDDTNEVTLTVADPGSDVTVTIPAATDTLVGRATTDTLTNKTLTSAVLNTGVSGTAVLDEDNMATDSATQLATQQSIKAYVDSSVSGLAAGDITDVGDATGPTAFTGANDGNQLIFEGSTDDTNEVTLTVADPGSDVTVTIPAATDTLVGRATTDTLTNKTLTSAVLNTGVSGTAILDEDNMATDSATQLATQQSIKAYVDSSVSGLGSGDVTDVGDSSGPTAFTGANDGNQLVFEGTTDDANDLTLVAADAGSNVTVTIPAATDTLVGRATTDTLTNKTLTSAVLNTGVSGTAILDEDNMATDSATQLATQQSIKAYVDSSVSGLGSGDVTDVGDSSGPTAFTGANDGNQLIFEGSTDDTNEVTLTVADPGADVTVTIPAATDTLVGRATTDTLTNKTLTSAVLNTGVSGTAILDEDNMATDSATQLATQQSIKAYVDSSVSGLGSGDVTDVGDSSGPTAFTGANDGNQLIFEGSTDDTNEVTLTVADPGADVTVTIPAATDTLVGRATTDTLTNKTLTSAVLNTGVSGTAILDEDNMATDSATQLATQQSIKAYVDSSVSGLAAGDITDVGDATGPTAFTGANDGNQLVFEGSTDDTNEVTLTVADPGADVTVTIPAATDTLVGRATTDTLTNKTLTSPTITTGVFNTSVSGTAILDEDNMATDSATQLATQQSIKAYVDSSVSGLGSGDVTDVGDSSGPTAFTGANDGNQLIFEGSTDDTNEVTLTVADPGADVTVTIPAATDTLVGRATTDTLTNKTLTSAVLNTGVSGTAILDEDSMATDSATQLATQQSIKAYVDSSVSGLGSGDITDVGDSTGPTAFTGANDGNQLIFEGSTDDTNEVTLTVADPGADVTVTIPAATDTLVGRATTDTLTNKTLTSAVLNTGVSGTAILDEDNMATDSATQLATQQSIKAYVDSSVSGLAAGDITDIGDATGPTAFTGANDGNQLIFEGSTDDTNEVTLTVADPGSDVTVTIPAATDTLVGRATTDTLTNKTLTSPTITTGVFNTSVSGTAILDEDNMATDSATQLATQQSIKAYVDSSVSGLAAGDITDIGDATGPTAFTGANDGNQLIFEGSTDDTNEVTLTVADPGADVTVTIPAATDTLVGRATTDTLTNKTLTSAVLNTGVSGTAILDEDNMATDSATQLATQQSIKAYVDSSVSGLGSGDVTDVGDSSGPTAFTGANDGNQLIFEGSTDDTNEVTLTVADPGSDVTVTIPAATDTLVGRATTDTLTNKTLTSAVLNTGVSGTAILDEDNMATDSATQLATQQSIKAYVDSSVSGLGSGDVTDVGDSSGPTAFTGANDGNQLIFEGSTDDTNEVTLTVADPGSDVTVTIPAATDTLVGRATTDTLTNKTLTSPTITTGVFNTSVSGTAILDEDNMVTDSATQLATQQSIKAYVDSSVSGLAAGDITDVGDATGPTAFTGANDGNQLIFEGSTDDTNEVTLTVADPGADVTVTIPAATDTLVGRATTDTLTNKTLTSAVLNTGVSGTAILDEDNMATDSATQLATQQSIKAYVDSSVSGLAAGDITDVGDATGPTAFTGANDGNQLVFEGTTDDANDLTLVAADAGSNVTVTIPAATDTLVGRATTDTLTNKTLTSAVLNTGVSGTAILDEDNMATDSATQLATQQSIKAYVDSSVSGLGSGDVTDVGDSSGPTAFTGANDGNQLVFEGTTDDANDLTLVAADAGSNVTVTIPAATDTLVGRATTDTLTNKTLTSAVLNTGVSGTAVLDEDNMATDSATQLATQQSIKAYVDSSVSGLAAGDITDVGDSSGPTAFTGANDGNQLIFEGSTDDTNEVTLTVADPGADVTVTIPAATDTLVGRATTDTLTNKTLTSPTITTGVFNTSVSGTAILDEDTMATDSATQLATQQSIKAYVDSSVSGLAAGDITDVGDATGPTAFTGANDGNQLIFEGSTDDTNEVTLTVADPGADVTVTIPAATDTLVGRATTDTLTNKTLTSAVLNTGVSGTAVLDEDNMATDSATQLATQQSIKAYVDSSVSGLAAGDITDVGDATGPTAFTGANDGNQLVFEGTTDDANDLTLVAADAGSNVTVTIPAATDTLVGRATTDTLTNKTLTSAVLNTGVSGTAVLDEDNMATDSATQLATQQSIKAYVDSSVSGLAAGDITDVGDATGPTAFTGANDGNQLIFEGSTDDTNEVTLTVADPGADVTVTIPAATDTLVGRATTDTLTNKTLTSAVLNTGVSGTAILDEDNMATDSATQLATQQSIKAYVDSSVSGLAAGDITDVGDATGPTAFTGANDGNQLIFEGSTDDTNEVTLTVADPGADVTVTIPAATDTLVGRATTDTLTNKTLTSAVLNTGVSGTAILDEDNMATDSATQLATQQSIKAYVDSSVSGLAAGDITDVGDATGPTAFTGANDGNQLVFEGTTDDANDLTLVAADAGSNVTVTIPAATDTLVGRATTDTLTNKTLTSAVLNTGVSGTAILDEDNMATDSATQLATQQSIKAYVDSSVSGLAAGDITDVGDATGPTAFTGANDGNQLIFEGSTDDTNEVTLTVADPGADVTVTIPAATDTLVGRATTDTLTNKTLTSAVLNTGVSGTAILDEDNMATDSATQLATQQSIKAYVDSSVSGLAAGDITDVGDATGPTAFTGANDGNQLVFEGTTDDANDLTLVAADAGSNVTVTIPAATDTLVGRATTDTLTNKTLTSAVLNTGVSGTAVLDEDNMATDSATQLATQQSIKAYVDSSVSGLAAGDITDVGDATGPTAFTGANDGNQLIFEGSTDDTNEVTLTVADPGADVTVTIPAATDTLVGRATTDTLTNKTLTSAVLNTGVSGTAVLDEDNMISNSATQLATQQSIKAYVDSQAGGGTLDEAYDQGGAGAGRSITVDSGAVQLTGSNGSDETLEVTNSDNGGALLVENTGTGASFRVNDESSDSTPFYINDAGLVGIGTTSPENLTVSGNDTGEVVLAVNNEGSGDSEIHFDLGGTTQFAIGIDNSDNDYFKIGAGNGVNLDTQLVINGVSDHIGIGTDDPQVKLHVSGGAICTGSDLECNQTDTEGVIYAASTSLTSYDLAEMYPTNDTTITAAEVVALDQQNGVFVKRAKTGDKLIGVISTEPGLLLGGFAGKQFVEEHQVELAMAGRIPTKVSTENGGIAIGDLLTISSMPGVARKANPGEQTIGYALQAYPDSYSPQEVGSIEVFVNINEGIEPSNNETLVGKAQLVSGDKLIRVEFTQRFDQAPVVNLTPMSFFSGQHRLAEVDKDGFTIELSEAQSNNVTFSWQAVSSDSASISYSSTIDDTHTQIARLTH